jgi:hypothetical protein
MIHDFYANTKGENKEIESEIKNFETEMEQQEEKHRVAIKVFIQKVKHLEYQHKNDCDKVKLDAGESMKTEKEQHVDTEKELRKEKEDLKKDYGDNDYASVNDIETTEKQLSQQLDEIKYNLDIQKHSLIEKYEFKLVKLREELELRMKVEIHEIEERKNQHINDLMTNHEKAFREMKDYYNDITRENLELIKMHREKLVDINATIEANTKTVDDIKQQNESMQKPLAKAK